MTVFDPAIRFRYPWRPYQDRVLGALDRHLDDDRLHLVAPPGSGKTVLGLEVVRRIGRPTLVLAPTRAIRDQWADRFAELFLPDGADRRAWISADLNRPVPLTVATYQALYALDVGGTGKRQAGKSRSARHRPFAGLRRAGIRTLVVDEAHHLKNEWWRSVTALETALDRPRVVALTATPPVDVSPAEWDRYRNLCGPVDARIGVPELVRTGTLCPHQDQIRLTAPTDAEGEPILRFRESVQTLRDDLILDFDFLDAVEGHPWLVLPEDHLRAIFEDTPFFAAMLVYINAAGRWISPETLETLGVSRKTLPALTPDWLETLLAGVLFAHPGDFDRFAPKLAEIRRRLARMGALEKNRVTLTHTRAIRRTLTRSVGKLDAIVSVTEAESELLGDRLRMVILADYIYPGEMPTDVDDRAPLRRLGVVPIFERIRREHLWGVRPGILCGSMVVVPESAVTDLEILAVEANLDPSALAFAPLPHDPGYRMVTAAGSAGARMVHMITRLFALGEVNLLVGTRSLLGEGWDAPWINTLVLATSVGAYALSSQMRGRAIRALPDDPDKTANIWHLVCLDPDAEDGGDDLATLERRFTAFMGLSADGRRIETGLDRMNLPRPPLSATDRETANAATQRRAADRAGMAAAWRSALAVSGDRGELVETVRVPRPAGVGPRSVAVAAWTSGLRRSVPLLITAAVLILWGIIADSPAGALGIGLGVLLGSFGLIALRRPLRMAPAWLRLGPAGAGLRAVAQAVIEALASVGEVRTPLGDIRVRVSRSPDGNLRCGLDGATPAEADAFSEALLEMVDPVAAPRYLIRPLSRRDQPSWLPVPQALARRKADAETFRRIWERRFGPTELIYTRTGPGQRELVRARLRSLDRLARSSRRTVWKA